MGKIKWILNVFIITFILLSLAWCLDLSNIPDPVDKIQLETDITATNAKKNTVYNISSARQVLADSAVTTFTVVKIVNYMNSLVE